MSERTAIEEGEISPYKRLGLVFLAALVLLGSLLFGTLKSEDNNRFAPDLALDLQGGTQIILTPTTTDGTEVTDSDVREAINIIRQRVDASGVAEAEITAQGGSNIIVALPGQPDQATLDLVRTSAVLRLRPVLTMVDGAQTPATGTEEDAKKFADIDGDGKISSETAAEPVDASDPTWITEQTLLDAYQLQCGTTEERLNAAADDPKKPFVACSSEENVKYILGPAELEGANIDQASSSLAVSESGTPTGGYAVNLDFDGEGADIFGKVTERLYQLEQPRDLFAIVLDGQVISAASPNGPILGGQAQITGNFTAEEAASLANQLNFGSLPLHFEVQSEEQISATLGTEQLSSGLYAGAIGALLIIVYMLWQYHALGVLAVLSISLATGLSYFIISFLSWTMGYRLSMAGVLGMIISIGVTADSFIVYFERIRDEIRDGRSLAGAVRHGWLRARRTIIISDFVNLLAAVVLYLLTVGSVRGFAFTLGVTTILDLVVVMMFTYPMMELLVRTEFFGQGKKFSGMDQKLLDATPIYRGRGRVAETPRKDKADAKKGYTPPAMPGGDAVELHDYEYPEARFTEAGEDDRRPGESLAKRRARQRRAQRKAEQAGEEN